MTTFGHLYAIRSGAYSVVVAAPDIQAARDTFTGFLQERSNGVPDAAFTPKRTKSVGDRPLLLAPTPTEEG